MTDGFSRQEAHQCIISSFSPSREQRRGQPAPGPCGGARSKQGRGAAAAARGGQAGGRGPSTPWGARPARASVPFEAGAWRRGFGRSALLLRGSPRTRGLASLPPAHGSPAPPRSPLNGSPAGKPRQSPVPPSPTSLSPGDASFPLPTSPFSSWQILPLLLDPAALIIASFSWRQIVQPGAAPEGFRPLTNSLLIFCQKGMERGGEGKGGAGEGPAQRRENQSDIHLHHCCQGTICTGWMPLGEGGVKKRRGWGEGEAGGSKGLGRELRGSQNPHGMVALQKNKQQPLEPREGRRGLFSSSCSALQRGWVKSKRVSSSGTGQSSSQGEPAQAVGDPHSCPPRSSR